MKKEKGKNIFQSIGEEIHRFVKNNTVTKSKNQKKMPIKILNGIRQKEKKVQKIEKEFNREAQIVYNSFTKSKAKNVYVEANKKENKKTFKSKINKKSKNPGFHNGVLYVNKNNL